MGNVHRVFGKIGNFNGAKLQGNTETSETSEQLVAKNLILTKTGKIAMFPLGKSSAHVSLL
jgi:hypothetical protein